MSGQYDEIPNVERQREGPAWQSNLSGGGKSSRLFSVSIIASAVFVLFTFLMLFLSSFSTVTGLNVNIGSQPTKSSKVPDYFQTTQTVYEGPTATGEPPSLAEINPAPFPSVSYIANTPLETQAPIPSNTNNANIFQMHGELSHYFPNPVGFGVDEMPIPPGSNISYVYMLHRHGARYPTTRSGAPTLAQKLLDAKGTFQGMYDLDFLNTWTYKLGAEILVPIGKEELFKSGVLHQYQYGHLYNNNGSKIIARSTTQHRMTESAEYFLSGFFGLKWTQNATLELIIEQPEFNNSLAGYYQCPSANGPAGGGGTNATLQWMKIYLAEAAQRIAAQIPGLDWTVEDSFYAQQMCAYETVALGFSSFCGLFTYDEWLGYEYAVDLSFSGNNAFQSPTGRAIGIGWVQEFLARLQHHTIDKAEGQVNVTLDSDPATFPTDQTLNFDFSHDTNIMAILTAFGLKQFASPLDPTKIVPRELIVSHLTPFAARLDIELITAPESVSAIRKPGSFQYDHRNTAAENDAGLQAIPKPVQYIHFVLNQRTIPLGKNFPECGERTDGWCELEVFLKVMEGMLEASQYEHACFGEYDAVPYGTIKDGVPLSKN